MVGLVGVGDAAVDAAAVPMTMEHSCEGADEALLLSKGCRISGAGSVVGFSSGLPWWGWWAWETRRSMLRPCP